MKPTNPIEQTTGETSTIATIHMYRMYTHTLCYKRRFFSGFIGYIYS